MCTYIYKYQAQSLRNPSVYRFRDVVTKSDENTGFNFTSSRNQTPKLILTRSNQTMVLKYAQITLHGERLERILTRIIIPLPDMSQYHNYPLQSPTGRRGNTARPCQTSGTHQTTLYVIRFLFILTTCSVTRLSLGDRPFFTCLTCVQSSPKSMSPT